MANHSKYNMVYRLQKWMDTVDGQTFLNYAYSWGASVVILGALFKLTHLPGANTMLFLGMGTEVFVFFISAFDRPFDKTAEGREIPTHVTEEYLATGKVTYSEGNMPAGEGAEVQPAAATAVPAGGAQPAQGAVAGGPTIIFTGGQGSQAAAEGPAAVAPSDAEAQTQEGAAEAGQAEAVAGQGVAAGVQTAGSVVIPQPNYVPQMSKEEAEKLNEAQSSYVDELKELVETLKKVNEQSERLTRDSEEMENLNRTLTGISKVYEMQLKGASQQIGTIDEINEQTRKMARQIEQLNQIYARMIQAMTVNMHVAAPGQPAAPQPQPTPSQS